MTGDTITGDAMIRTMRIALCSLLLATGAAVAQPPDDADDFINHLEFVGYECEVLESWVRANHDEQILMLFKAYQGGILVQNFAETSDRERTEIIDTVNTLNGKATVTKFYIDSEGDVMIEAWYPGEYDKKMFANFLEAWQGDTKGQSELIMSLLE